MPEKGDVQIVPLLLGTDAKDKPNHLTAGSLRITETEQFYQVKRMIEGMENVPCSTYSQTLNG